MKTITFSQPDYTDRELRKIWCSLCSNGIPNEVTWAVGTKKLYSIKIEEVK